jgi:hypothetical protein
MLIQFKVVQDDSCWFLDTVQMRYARTDGSEDKSEILEMGKIVFVGMQGVLRIFALEGRTVSTDGPGAGLCTFGYALVDLDTTLTFYIQCNVPVKDIISRRPIDTVKYELIPQPQENTNEEGNSETQRQTESEVSGSVSEGTAGEESVTPETNI